MYLFNEERDPHVIVQLYELGLEVNDKYCTTPKKIRREGDVARALIKKIKIKGEKWQVF